MGCTVKITAECQVAVTDPKGGITGMKWVTQPEAKKNQLVRVIATMTGTCRAKIRIEWKPETKGTSTLALKSAPPAPQSDLCTMYGGRIFWADLVNTDPAEKLPYVTFTAIADCSECECEDSKKESTASCFQQFNDH